MSCCRFARHFLRVYGQAKRESRRCWYEYVVWREPVLETCLVLTSTKLVSRKRGDAPSRSPRKKSRREREVRE